LEKRNQVLLSLLEDQSYASNKALIGKDLEVLVEAKARRGEGKLMGRSLCFRKVNFSANHSIIGDLKTVRITGASPSSLTGELI